MHLGFLFIKTARWTMKIINRDSRYLPKKQSIYVCMSAKISYVYNGPGDVLGGWACETPLRKENIFFSKQE